MIYEFIVTERYNFSLIISLKNFSHPSKKKKGLVHETTSVRYNKHNLTTTDILAHNWTSFSCIISQKTSTPLLCVADTGIPSSLQFSENS